MEFRVMGKPQGKGRPRFRRTGEYVRTYSPHKTAAYEDTIRREFLAAGGQMLDGAVTITIIASFMPPKHTAKKLRPLLMGKPYLHKPDTDNIIKIVLDALNGVAYEDDKQVYSVSCLKIYDEVDGITVFVDKGGGE